MPWTPKDAKRHTKKAKSPKAKRQWSHVADSVLERGGSEGSAIRQANGVIAQHYAGGGAFQSPLASVVSQPHAVSPQGSTFGVAKMRMPRVPIADTMRNVDASIFHAKKMLPSMAKKIARPRGPISGEPTLAKGYDEGGRVGLSQRAVAVLKDALSHLSNKDASSASATLRSSPELMANPSVSAAMNGLRASTGIAPATKTLTGLVNMDTNATIMPTYRRGGRR